jgi:SAM-dependent methyltransferase
LLALPEHIHVYNTESTGAVHEALKSHKHYQCSEYFGPEHVRGSLVNGVRHEDLQALSFSDQTFDLVLSSDVLEHMPWPYVAHAEIFRVLKPGGRHIFTVPYDPSAAQDDCRAELCGTEIRHLKPPQYHGDPVRPDEGVLVWYIFGREMQEHLKHIGFEVETLLLHAPRKGIIGDNAIVFVASKP